jgi:hypothetical protein
MLVYIEPQRFRIASQQKHVNFKMYIAHFQKKNVFFGIVDDVDLFLIFQVTWAVPRDDVQRLGVFAGVGRSIKNGIFQLGDGFGKFLKNGIDFGM